MFSKNFGASLFLAAVFSSLTLEQATAQTLYGSAGSQDQRENAIEFLLLKRTTASMSTMSLASMSLNYRRNPT